MLVMSMAPLGEESASRLPCKSSTPFETVCEISNSVVAECDVFDRAVGMLPI